MIDRTEADDVLSAGLRTYVRLVLDVLLEQFEDSALGEESLADILLVLQPGNCAVDFISQNLVNIIINTLIINNIINTVIERDHLLLRQSNSGSVSLRKS